MAIAAAAALALAGCGSGSTTSGAVVAAAVPVRPSRRRAAPGITATTVTVGGHFPLTGPAAPGYSEIPRAIDAYFQHVNANGGVNGRKLKMIIRDDGYNPVNTVKVTKQLVLQDKVFAILGGLGTPTHTKVVDYLNAAKVPDIFVSSGCRCWDEPGEAPVHVRLAAGLPDRGQDPRRSTSPRTSRARRSPTSSRTTTSAPTASTGWTCTCPRTQVVTRQTYEPGNTDIGPQMAKIKASGAEVVASFSIPAYTALRLLAGVKLDFHPQMVVSNVGADPTTLTGLLKAFSKGEAGASLIDGIVTDGYLPPPGDTSNSWIALFEQDPRPVHPEAAEGRQRALRDGDGLHVRRRAHQGGPNPSRQDLVDTLEKGGLKGPGLVPFRFSAESHAGFTGVADRARSTAASSSPRASRPPPTTARARSPSTRRPSPKRPQRRPRRPVTPDRPRWQWSSRSTPSRSPRAAARSSRRASPSAPPRSTECRASAASSCCAPSRARARYFVVTHWDSDEDFQNWVKSAAFTRGHAQARADNTGTVAHGSAVLEFEVVDLSAPPA